MADNLTYNEAIAAVTEGSPTGPLYAALPSSFPGWPEGAYIGYVNGQIIKTTPQESMPYSPTESDKVATEWYDGPDHPPK